MGRPEASNDDEALFWRLYAAAGEDEVAAIVRGTPSMQVEANWYPYGGNSSDDRSNHATFDNQQANPVAALVEKLTNAIDSILLKECRLSGIEPKSAVAPASVSDAVEKFFGIKRGDFSEIDSTDRSRIAENVQVIAGAQMDAPDLTIFDNGEGQHPDDFPSTFLSLLKNNKANIPFVQGKYNMGSTGAVVFSGQKKFQLIASRLHPDLRGSRDDVVGYTLVRRHPLTPEEERDSKTRFVWYEYFNPGGRIARFPGRSLDAGLYRGRMFESGSLVKLFSYQLPPGVRSYIVINLWRELNQYLYHPALPILLFDPRVPKQRHPTTPMLGNKMRIALDERDKIQKTISMKLAEANLGEANIDITVFRHGLSQKEFINEKAVIFTVNGQVQGHLPRAFISQKLRMPMLKDSLLINVDCQDLTVTARMEIFQANRSNMRESLIFQALVDRLIELVRDNTELRRIHEERKNSIIQDKSQDRDLIRSVFKDMRLDKRIVDLLKQSGGSTVKEKKRDQRTDRREKKDTTPKDLKRFPSFLFARLKDEEGRLVKAVPVGGKGVIEFETNAEDEYFFRPKEPGDFQMELVSPKTKLIHQRSSSSSGGAASNGRVEDYFGVARSGPTDGVIRLTLKPKENLSVGDEVCISVRLTSPGGDHEIPFYVRMTGAEPPKKRKETAETPPALPTAIKVYQNPSDPADKSWDEYGWNATDVVKVIAAGNVVEAIAINMDSAVLKDHLSAKRLKTEGGIKNAKDKYFVAVYLHSLYLFGSVSAVSETGGQKVDDVEDYIGSVFKLYGRCMLALDQTSDIEEND